MDDHIFAAQKFACCPKCWAKTRGPSVDGCKKQLLTRARLTVGPVYTRAFEHCKVSLDCTNSSACKGDIAFGTHA